MYGTVFEHFYRLKGKLINCFTSKMNQKKNTRSLYLGDGAYKKIMDQNIMNNYYITTPMHRDG